MSQRIMVPVDGSDTAYKALVAALQTARESCRMLPGNGAGQILRLAGTPVLVIRARRRESDRPAA
jgi:nucleotide-binding universal stress UspA family protein